MMSSTINGRKATVFLCVLILMCSMIVGCSSSGNSGQSQSTAAESASNSSSTAEASSQSSSSSSTTAKADKNGFDPNTNSTIVVASTTFQLPSYYGSPETNGATTTCHAEKGKGETLLSAATPKMPIHADQFNSEKSSMVDQYVKGYSQGGFTINNVQTHDATLLEMPAIEFEYTFKYQKVDGKAKGIIFLNEAAGEVGVLSLVSSNESTFDYFPDFERILESATANAEIADSDANATGNSEVSPDLKETMDSYEAFMDEYIDFMKRYQESGDAMSMLQDYTDYMTKYTDFMQKVDKLDTSNMSAADSAYYIEVTTRVSKKLLEVSL